ncbi:hypothetical protein EYF80_027604 [Liparis tanakae]|uniref:Uncharacterized protein n=1 Tax=Liparis tanakae TaxID=230148 RepID=A0A4Z2HBG3_9TELE|nr:hypothetical protein EYF80_027604 [Liparis tanakae]
MVAVMKKFQGSSVPKPSMKKTSQTAEYLQEVDHLDLYEGGPEVDHLDLNEGGPEVDHLDLNEGGPEVDHLDLYEGGPEVDHLDLYEGGPEVDHLDLYEGGPEVDHLDLNEGGPEVDHLDLYEVNGILKSLFKTSLSNNFDAWLKGILAGPRRWTVPSPADSPQSSFCIKRRSER